MNYTSVPVFGEKLVEEIIADENLILIYKPHSALGTRDENAQLSHEKIISLISKSSNSYIMNDEDINNIFTLVDFAFFDNTSVMVDYLYTNKPAAYIEVLEDQSINDLRKAFVTVNKDNFNRVMKTLYDELNDDINENERKKVKEYYLGNYKKGESTKLFINEIDKLIVQRDNKIKNVKNSKII